jgi:ABC-2 type transport system permease protein
VNALFTAGAFLRKDFLEETSYRLRFLVEICGAVIAIYFLVIFSEFMGDAVAAKLGNIDYLPFALVGIAFHSLHETALNDFSRKIREAQTLGTLEALISTRTSVFTLMACLPLYSMCRTSLKLVGYMLVGSLILDVNIHWGNWPATLTLFAISMVVFGCLGLTFAALTVVFKRTEPIIRGFNLVSFLLGGVFVPLTVFPEWMQKFAMLIPVVPALHGFRQAVLYDADWATMWPDIAHVLVFMTVLVPLSVMALRWAVRRAMLDGSLTQY